MRRVHRHRLQVVIVTSAEEDELDHLLTSLGCEDEIDDIVHGGAVDSAKPAPDLYQFALDTISTEPARAVALGDTIWDVLAAGRAGIPCITVETGGIPSCMLEAAGATAVYPSCEEILKDYDASLLGSLA